MTVLLIVIDVFDFERPLEMPWDQNGSCVIFGMTKYLNYLVIKVKELKGDGGCNTFLWYTQQLVGTPKQLSPQNAPYDEVSIPTGNKVQIRSTACKVQFSHETFRGRGVWERRWKFVQTVLYLKVLNNNNSLHFCWAQMFWCNMHAKTVSTSISASHVDSSWRS